MEHTESGPSLAEFSPWLNDPRERHRRILEVVERDSVIEGLPPFRVETRAQIAAELTALAAHVPAATPRQ